MAPTICSEKKPRQIRTNLKEIRRQPNTTSALLSSVAAASASVAAGMGSGGVATNNSNGNAPIATSIINYVGSARNSSALRVRGGLDIGAAGKSFTGPLRVNRLQLLERNQQISDNVVSSSTTTGLEMMRAITAEQMDLDNDITDEEDCEVHSITSGAQCRNNNKNNNNCNVKTVFPASMLHDKQSLPPTRTTKATTANNHNSQQHYQQQYYASDDDEHDSDTYSSICEIKNTEGLLAIALKTIKLVKRNQMLQRRLAQLQLETSEFIQSVLANPENRHFRDKIQTPSSPSVTSASSPSASPLAALQSPTATTTTTATAGTQQQSSNAAEA